MKKTLILFTAASFFLGGCFSNIDPNAVVSQKFVHKYGFDVSEEEWEEREEEGQIVSLLKNGVKITESYENGLLHGPTIFTFPHSTIPEKIMLYSQGILLKEIVHDEAGIPIKEDAYELDDRKITTLWDENGSPLSIEEHMEDNLREGKYYTPAHELEGQVTAGFGERYKRDRTGLLLSRDLIEGGTIARRTNYHPNGQTHSISHYSNGELHGEQKKFTSNGKPLMDLHWNLGVLDGLKVVYRNGVKVAQIPYVNGQKSGLEQHFDDLGNLAAQIEWKADKKHGASKFFTGDAAEEEWFYQGTIVTQEKFESLSSRDQLIADFVPDAAPQH